MYRCSYIRVPDCMAKYMAKYMADHPRFLFGLYYAVHNNGIPHDSYQRDDNTRAWCSVVMLGLAAAHRSISSRRSPTTSEWGINYHYGSPQSQNPVCSSLTAVSLITVQLRPAGT
jgi:hypothetical protein